MQDSPADTPPLRPATLDPIPLRALETPRRLILTRTTPKGEEHWGAVLPAAFQHTRKGSRIRTRDDVFLHDTSTLYQINLSDRRQQTLARRGTPLQCVAASEWQELMTELMASLVPECPNQGVTLLVRHAELFLYRTSEGQLEAVDLTRRPSDIPTVRTIDEATFSRSMARYLEHRLPTSLRGNRRFLFRTGLPRSGADYVYINLDHPRLLYLNRRSESIVPGLSILGAIDTVVIRSHLVAMVKNPVSSTARLANLGITALLHVIYPFIPDALIHWRRKKRVGTFTRERMEQRLNRICHYPAYPASLRLYVDGETYFPRLLDAIAQAQKSIMMRTYIFDNDDYASKVCEALSNAVKRGVNVQVLYDRMGSRMAWMVAPGSGVPSHYSYPLHMGRFLTDTAGLTVRESFNPWFTSDHTKVTIVDDEIAFMGGMNIGREYRYEWHDLMVEIRGPLVGRLRKDNRKAWAHAGPFGDAAYLTTHLAHIEHAAPVEPSIPVRPLYTRTGRFEIYRGQYEAARMARKRIFITNPYFTDSRLLRELTLAQQRGVDVRVILPGTGNHSIMNASNAVTANRLLAAGVRVFTYPGMTHLKAAVFDDWACIGSANLDRLSLAVNQECNIGFDDPATVQELIDGVFEKDFALCDERTEPNPVGWGHHLLSAVAGWL